MRQWIMLVALLFVHTMQVTAQQEKKTGEMQGMPGMQDLKMPEMDMGENPLIAMHPETFRQVIVRHDASGTGVEPNSSATPMLMKKKGPWELMFHANAFLLAQQQSSPRGGDKLFSTNWLMGMAQRPLGQGVLTFRVMLSLEPATITGRQYPLLFQKGETAFGHDISDGKHPHNFFMEIAALYDLKLGKNGLLSFYAAPVGDPAIGPVAYPHRASASEDPLASLGHHQQDSTHIAADVVTVGLAYRIARIEVSAFHGREPGENRWGIQQGTIDSWATRFTLQLGKNWSGQFSCGRIASPEGLFPAEDQNRLTASVMYNRPLRAGKWASAVIWGRTRSVQDHSIFNSYTLESTARFYTRNYAWMRLENVDRSNELLLGENSFPVNFQEQSIGRVQAYSFGYSHDIDLIPHLATALGAQVTAYNAGNNLKPIYGLHPAGVTVFLRIRPFSGSER